MVDHSPTFNAKKFCCPHCGTVAVQVWSRCLLEQVTQGRAVISIINVSEEEDATSAAEKRFAQRLPVVIDLTNEEIEHLRRSPPIHYYKNLHLAYCQACSESSIWVHDSMIFPSRRAAATASPDLPPDMKVDFDEAARIVHDSPRGAVALLRLCVEKLCKQLGNPKNGLNDNIRALVAKGLDEKIRQSLDILRVIGNEAVHPGHIDIRDNRQMALTLFELINLIVDDQITRPAAVNAIYLTLPPEELAKIAKRDAGKR